MSISNNEESYQLPVTTTTSPTSPRSNSNRLLSGSKQISGRFGSQKFSGSDQYSYSASQAEIRSQTLAIGDLGSLTQEDNEDDDIVSLGTHDPDVSKSNLSILMELDTSLKEEPPVPKSVPKTEVIPPTPIERTDATNPFSVAQSPHVPEAQKHDERKKLLDNHNGHMQNYVNGSARPGEDDLAWEGKKPWFHWLPCFGDNFYLPQHDGEEPHPTPRTRITPELIFKHVILNPISYIPAVILGLLLNLLDAISYGMITFPISQPIFSQFGPDGVSMFFVSCIVSQLVYSLGGSIFGSGNGSMMIEVVPFLHIMAEIIIREVGEDNQKSIIATTILSFAISTVVTGVVFLILGAFKLGSLIEFFPRHILVGCIGGVGWFLVATGVEVSARLDGNLQYTWPMFEQLFLNAHIFALWSSAFGLAILLRVIDHKYPHQLLVPLYFMAVPLMFYLIVYLFGLKWEDLRDDGWVFPLPEGSAPWWRFYTYFDLKETNWNALLQTVPAMLALTFFGILHVPINVPALGVSIGEDNVNTNRELVAHGFSNILSGLVGSVQNYLVYANSVLFYKCGGDSRVSGVMLAAATAVILFVGPWIVGYVPVMVVGALIFHLGLDLMKEALIDTWGCVNQLEYLTIWAIVISMTGLGFVEGIFLGIIMACVFFVASNSRKNAIRATYSGSSVNSTVRRLYCQQKFLKQVGNQIYAIKLQGYMFFGTINGVEKTIRKVLDFRQWRQKPIRFLIVDFLLVTGLDYSAATAFVRIKRLLSAKEVYLVLCGVAKESEVGIALRSAGLWRVEDETSDEYLQIFENFNETLEWCENELLQAYQRYAPTNKLGVENRTLPKEIEDFFSSPRHNLVKEAGQKTLAAADNNVSHTNNQLCSLLIQVFQDTPSKGEEFFNRLSGYFHQINVPSREVLWRPGDRPNCLYLVERGQLRAAYRPEGDQARLIESIMPRTMVGELSFFANRARDATLTVVGNDNDCVLWQMQTSDYEKLLRTDPRTANEFMRLSLNFSAERLVTMTYYASHFL